MSEELFNAISSEAAAIIARLEELRAECLAAHEAQMAALFKEAA